MSYLLTKVKAAGYKVADKKTAHGTRIITVEGGTTWFRAVLKKDSPRIFLEHIVSRLQRLANNPVR